MNINNSYFQLPTLGNLLTSIDRIFHPYRYSCVVELRGYQTTIQWTERAEWAMVQREKPLIAGMQLYFSCFVKKRVVFTTYQSQQSAITVNERLSITFHPVQSQTCDPIEFVRNYPVKKELGSAGADKMHPSHLRIDYRNGEWFGQFFITADSV